MPWCDKHSIRLHDHNVSINKATEIRWDRKYFNKDCKDKELTEKNFVLTPWRFLQMASFMPWHLHLNCGKSILMQFVIFVNNTPCLTNKDMEQHDIAVCNDLIYIFNNHTPQSWHCLLLYPLNTTQSLLTVYSALLPLILQDDTSNTLPYCDWQKKGLSFIGFKNSQK